jgi:hypothetical protein
LRREAQKAVVRVNQGLVELGREVSCHFGLRDLET